MAFGMGTVNNETMSLKPDNKQLEQISNSYTSPILSQGNRVLPVHIALKADLMQTLSFEANLEHPTERNDVKSVP